MAHANFDTSVSSELAAIDVAARDQPIALSYAQDRYWLLSLLEPGNVAYNSARALRLSGVLNRSELEKAVAFVFARHEALRTCVAIHNGKPVLKVVVNTDNVLTWNDPSEIESILQKTDDIIEHVRRMPFELTRAPLVRVVVVKLAQNDHLLVVVAHKIMIDESSLERIFIDLGRYYSALVKGNEPLVESLALQFPDFARWQCEQAHGVGFAGLVEYWKYRLSGELPILELGTDFPRPVRTTYRGKCIDLDFPPTEIENIAVARSETGATLIEVFFASLLVALAKHTGQSDFVFGSPSVNRVRPGTSELIGRLSTVLPIRFTLPTSCTYRELIELVKSEYRSALLHQELPFERLMEELPPVRDMSRHPLFQLFVQENSFSRAELEFSGIEVSVVEPEPTTVMFDLEFQLKVVDGSLSVRCIYNEALYSEGRIRAFTKHIVQAIKCLKNQFENPIAQVDILDDVERDVLVFGRNSSIQALPETQHVHILFERQVQDSPDKIALCCGDECISFRELNSRANQLGRLLLQSGANFGLRIGICLERSIDMMVAILATLKVGGTYVPIDPAYPQDRQAFMIEDADVKIVLTRRAAANQLTSQSAKVVCLDEQTESLRLFDSNNLNLEVPRDALLYMIFTSGSTGRPKGSLVYHRGFVNLLTWYTRELEFGSNTTVLVFSSLSFDLTQKNLFSTLVTGGKLVLLESVYYDAERILNLIQQHGVTLVNCTPSAFYGLLSNTSESSLRRLEPLRFVVLGGESISTSRMRSWIESPFFHAEFVNSYGPTECTDVVAFFRVKEPKNYGSPIPIGKAVPNTHLYVLDDSLRIVPDGAPGELCIGGICVGAGYVNRAELNEQKFVQLALRGDPNERFYRTGDRVRYLSDGNIDFLGRVDHQVKLRGYRIELGEIQNALERCEEVRESYVMAHKDERGEQALVAYIVLNNPSQENAITSIRKRLLESLPEYMVPSTFIPLDAMPLTPNGKVDRARLPTPGTKSKEKRPRKLQKPSGQGSRERAESLILQRWSELLQLDEVSTTDRFFDIGGTSLKAIQFVGALGQELDISIPMVALFQSPTIAEFVQYIKTNFASKFVDKFGSDDASSVGNSTAQNEVTSRHERSVECDIAIIGMSARVPGAKNVEEFWNMLRDGVEGVRFLSDDELLSAGVDPKLIADPTYVKAVAAMDDVEGFDAEFFGMLKREVELMDPQHRAILEGAYVALEHAGYINLANRLRVGVFAGVARDAYFTSNLLAHPIFRNLAGDYSLMIGNEKDFPATRVAYRLNLKGPAVNVQTACSSSGVAIQLASQNLVLGECDVALAGGCRVLVPLTGYQYVEGGTLSPDGHVRAFDAKGRGMIRGSGVCFVVLKRLDRALEDGDSIYGVIRAVSVNNDGSAKVGFAAPSVQGQSSVIQSALLKSGVNPESIGYVETHGTATAIGDPIEMAALTDAFSRSTNKKAFCAIGSVKTNIGHLDAGSCVAGLIKTVLAIKNGQIPPSLNYETPNPQIDFPNTPFFVNTALRSWQTNGEPRRAGVSSFGLGGTNVHVIVEEHHAQPTQPGKGCEVFVLSAKTTTALESLSANLAKFLSDDSSINLADVAFTLQEGRQQFDCRRAIVARDFNEAIAEIKSQENRIEGTAFAKKPSVVFMFSGQGSQHVNMARDLYEKEPTFQAFFDEACDAFLPHLGLDLRTIIYPKVGEEGEATSRINQTQFAQPSLFVVGYALANYLIELGIEPDCMIGHSVGEYAAACISGVFALEDVAKILSARARLMQSQPRGSMRAVRLPEAELLPLLKDGVSLAASNSPMLSVVSGTDEAIALFDAELAARGLATTVLHTSHAFHSEMMDPICAPFAEVVRAVKAAPATIPILSTATVEWLTEKEATATDYWVSQLRLPVRFSSVVTELAKSDNRVFIECGPNTALTNAVKAHLSKENSRRVINCLPHVNEPRLSRIVFHSAIGRLWTLGGTPDWSKVRGDGKRRRVGLPSYPFERRRFWVDNQNAESELSNPRKCEPRGEPNISSVETERSTLSSGTLVNSNNSFAARIVNQQLELMSRQLGLLMNARERVRVTTSDTSERNRNVNVESIQSQTKDVADVASPVAAVKPETTLDNTNAASSCGSTFVGPQSRITKTSNTNLSTCQRAYLDKLIALYNRQTRESKAFAEKHRNHLADPRVVSGFKPIIKELVYPIVVNKSLGARLWDIDGNEYVDMLNGFGSNFFGHRAPFVIEALEKQFREGIEIGPQHPLAGELAEEITEFLGHDRVAFCNTGSEAVLGAMRIARASTGRDVIAMFAGSYHGIFDEVIVRGTKSLRSLPAAPGIQPGAVANILVLDYATDESLRILKERAGTLAAILVEPVQSRKPDLQPRQFLHELRRLTRESNTCLIFDEVVTGFRAGKTGAQGFFGLKADVATYGKVLGGGMNIGVIAGDRRYMDALDGGAWHFGDQSVPEVGVTYFAGTFVRHPPALVAARAVINYLKQKDASFYESINARTARFVDTVNAHAKRIKAPLKLAHFASVVRVEWTREFALSELLFVHLRQKGVHIWDHRPVYLTAAHSDDDIAFVAKAFVESLDEMKQGEILPES